MLQSSTIIAILLLSFSSAFAHSQCFKKHINDAITLNETRKEIYAKYTHGKSLSVSHKLIQFEKSMRFQSWFADAWADYFHFKNIPVVCNDLVNMNYTPKLPDILPLNAYPSSVNFININYKKMKFDLESALESGLKEVYETATSYIPQLLIEQRLNCMTRHFLESIAIFSKNGQRYIQNADFFTQAQLRLFLRQIIKSHISYLKTAIELDQSAVEFQTQGIPILCHDIPPIPYKG